MCAVHISVMLPVRTIAINVLKLLTRSVDYLEQLSFLRTIFITWPIMDETLCITCTFILGLFTFNHITDWTNQCFYFFFCLKHVTKLFDPRSSNQKMSYHRARHSTGSLLQVRGSSCTHTCFVYGSRWEATVKSPSNLLYSSLSNRHPLSHAVAEMLPLAPLPLELNRSWLDELNLAFFPLASHLRAHVFGVFFFGM